MTRNSDPKSYRKLAYTYTEARELLSMCQRTWMKLVISGEIRPLNGHNIVALAELERYLKDHTKEREPQKKAIQKNKNDKPA